ncbi:TGF-beta-activated kinase 1 and MAP3K7-binding protein 1-like [Hydractinia symbiolongicarpus]|uniref:TGF-beta-activated kinase 1 and MAP3K7-binding protein 1-like n=1 Tax=Hydractinia symbiolongicarpus TaxID=13093 RepID=UPI00254D77F2|nr:TGF-beta-activated kinase 1 and MAP3K7-binding protein 1-like [Hydractinia symbiolongicarpus]
MSMKNHSQLVGALYNWTDDLPVCKQSGVGYQTNHLYRAGGDRGEVSDYEDRSFHFQCPDDCYLYGIIDGHGGFKVAEFAVQKLPAELLLGQLKDDYADREVCAKLQEAFEGVAKGFVDDLINDALMEKMNLEEQMPERMNQGEAFRRFPTLFQRLQELDVQISGGCSAVIALIHKSRLYVANVGDARAVLCRLDENSGEQGVVQLSTDHTISSNSELRRLDSLGLDIEKLQVSGLLTVTRSLGDWALKGGYKNIAELSSAKEEPILSTPSVHGGEQIDASMQFLFMMSEGVYKAYQEATGTPPEQVNNNIAFMVGESIMKQTTIKGVAQSVVDQICLLHSEQYLKSQHKTCIKREDMTLLVRLFSAELGKPIVPFTSVGIKAKKAAVLTPLIIPQPPVQRAFLPSIPHDNVNRQTAGGSPSSPIQQQHSQIRMQSPLTVTVTNNQDFHGEADNNPSMAAYYPQQQTPLPGNSKTNNYSPRNDDTGAQLFRGFTDQQQREFFRPRTDKEAPLLIPKTSESIKSVSVTSNSNKENQESSANTDMEPVQDRTKLFNRPAEPLETDANGRIKAHVSFTEFLKKVDEMGGERVVFSQFLDGKYFGI